MPVLDAYNSITVQLANGFMAGGRASKITASELSEHFKVDVIGALHCVQQILPKQIERGEGAIIFTGGLFGVYPNANADYACNSMKNELFELARRRRSCRRYTEERIPDDIIDEILKVALLAPSS